MNAEIPARCSFCGAANPDRLRYCPLCFRPLPEGGVPGDPPSATDPLVRGPGLWPGPVGPLGAALGRAGLLWVSLGIASAILGIGFLVAGSFVHLIGSTVNRACAGGPFCIPSLELSVIFWAVGATGLILGIVLIAFGFHRSVNRSSWLTLPP